MKTSAACPDGARRRASHIPAGGPNDAAPGVADAGDPACTPVAPATDAHTASGARPHALAGTFAFAVLLAVIGAAAAPALVALNAAEGAWRTFRALGCLFSRPHAPSGAQESAQGSSAGAGRRPRRVPLQAQHELSVACVLLLATLPLAWVGLQRAPARGPLAMLVGSLMLQAFLHALLGMRRRAGLLRRRVLVVGDVALQVSRLGLLGSLLQQRQLLVLSVWDVWLIGLAGVVWAASALATFTSVRSLMGTSTWRAAKTTGS
jgi:hypothetical protein